MSHMLHVGIGTLHSGNSDDTWPGVSIVVGPSEIVLLASQARHIARALLDYADFVEQADMETVGNA